LPITPLQSKLQYSSPFRNASVPSEGRSSNCDRVAAKINSSFSNSGGTGPMFTEFSCEVAALLPLLMRVFTRRYCSSFWYAEARTEGDQSPQNQLITIATSLKLSENERQINYRHKTNVSVKTENFVISVEYVLK